jgi:hypothetical protein
LNKLTILASRLGFKSDQISLLRNKNIGQYIAQGFFKSLCREEFYKYEEHRVQSISNRLQSFLQNLPRYIEEEGTTAQFTTNNPELEASHRFNSPTRDEYGRQRRNIFVNQMFGPNQPQSEYITSLGVIKDIISCFFRKTLFLQLLHEQQAAPPQSPLRLAEAAPESIEADIDFEEQLPAVQPTESPLSEEVHQPSTNSGLGTTEEDFISEPVEIDHHPSGTPDRDIALLAAGFEEISQPIETKSYIIVHQKVPEILST